MKKSGRLALRIDPDLKNWLRTHARKKGQNMSKVVERGLVLVRQEEGGRGSDEGSGG